MENSVLGFRGSIASETLPKRQKTNQLKKIIVKIASIPTKRRLNANSEKKTVGVTHRRRRKTENNFLTSWTSQVDSAILIS